MKIKNSLLLLFLGISTSASSAVNSDRQSIQFMNVNLDPVQLLVGSTSVAVDFGISESITIGPSMYYSYHSLGVTTGQSIVLGMRSIFFLGHARFTDGWFVTPFFQWGKSSSSLNLTGNGPVLGVDVGYWWFWESGVNVGLGLGLKYNTIDLKNLGLDTRGSATSPSFLVQFGYSF